MHKLRAALLLTALLLTAPTSAWAGRVEATTWEAFALDTPVIVEAECVTAGLRIARYRVVDAWKGLEDGAELVVDAPGVHLVGDRRLLALEPQDPPRLRTIPDFLMGDSVRGLYVPLTYRRLQADWQTPLYRGTARLPLRGDKPLRGFATETHTELPALRADVRALLDAEPETRELQVLRSYARLYLGGTRYRRDPDLLAAVEAADGVEPTLDLLMEARRYEVVGKGRERALARLAARDDFQLQVRDMRQRLGLDPRPAPAKPAAREPSPAPSPEQLQGLLRGWLDEAPGSHDALRPLVEHAPRTLIEALCQRRFGPYDNAYWLGSYVAATIPAEQRDALPLLLEAREPWLQVAGAIYLCFDDLEAGLAALRARTTLPDGPGAWAALTLARRGEADALPRAVQVLAEEPSRDTERAGLTYRAVILLSNAAARAEVPAPPSWDDELTKRDPVAHGARYVAWFESHAEALREVGDPWLPLLEAQRVD